MPVTKSAKGALKVAIRNTLQNTRIKRRVHAVVKNARSVKTQEALSRAYSVLDRASKLNIIHPNKASRLKSRLTALISK